MRKKSAPANGSSPDGDLPRLVDDMFIFQNMEFTKVVGNRFLVCVDCEIGPIGCHCLDDKNSFYAYLLSGFSPHWETFGGPI